MQSQTSLGRRAAGLLGLIALLSVLSTVVAAQTSAPLLLLLDQDALENRFAPDAVNDPIADVGVRDQLPFFAAHVGERLTLPGAEGWFGFVAVPEAWNSAPGQADGLQNYFLAGPGLGSPDANGQRDSLLDGVPGVVGLQPGQLASLAGRRVCAVVYNTQISSTGTPPRADLKGTNLGIFAGRIVGVSPDATVEIEILSTHDTCSAALALFSPSQ